MGIKLMETVAIVMTDAPVRRLKHILRPARRVNIVL